MSTATVENWTECDLSDLIAAMESGQRPYGGVTEDGGEVPSLGGENIRQEGGLELSAVRKVPTAFYNLMAKGVLRAEDVLINKDGANTGKVGLYEGQFPVAAINEHVFLLRGKPERLAQRFLYRLLAWGANQQLVRTKISGSAQPGLKSDFIRFFPVRVPAAPTEQSQIAVVLDTVDEVIAETEAVIAKLKQVRAGLLHDLLTLGLDTSGQLRDPIVRPEQFQDSTLGRVPVDWVVRTLEDVTEPSAPICYGIVQAFGYVPNGVPVLVIRDLLGDYVTGVHRTSPSIDAAYARSRVRAGDVLISVKGTIGRLCVVPQHYSGNISRDLARIRPLEWVRSRFLFHLLSSPLGQKTLEKAQVGTTRAELSIAPLRRLAFAFPRTLEQDAIARILDEQETALCGCETELVKVRKLKAGLMADLLTGRVRVPETIATGRA